MKGYDMQARMRWWLIAVCALVVVALLAVTEPVTLGDRQDPNTGKGEAPAKQIGPFRFYKPHMGLKLGLDLRGGSHLVLQVQPEGYFEFSTAELGRALSEEQKTRLHGDIVGLLSPTTIGTGKREVELTEQRIVVRTRAATEERTRESMEQEVRRQSEVITELLKERFPDVEMKEAKLQPSQDEMSDMLSSVEFILDNRVNAYGLTEPVIQRQPPDRVIVELPGVSDPEKAKELIKQTATLEFRHVPREYAFGEKQGPDISGVPTGQTFTFRDRHGDEVPTAKVIDESPVILTGRGLKANSARVVSVPGQETAVVFTLLGGKGGPADIFEDFTRKHVDHYLAVVLDGEMQTCPIIREPIPGGEVRITGGFDTPGTPEGLERAKELKILLNAGALPLDLEYVEERTVSAQLGKDALVKSLWAGLIGLGAVLLFMVGYYRVLGALASVALIVYCILLMGFIKLVNQVLTLPGIVAVILSIGMAVDANIIIFERLKEEIRTGKTMRSAVDAGFKRAWAAILDSNVCSIGTGVVLYYFGTGPIRGFAVALIAGVVVSLFTAVTVTRLFVQVVMRTGLARNVRLFGVAPSEVEGA